MTIPHPADRTPRDWWLLGWRSAARYNFPDEDMAREHWPPDAAEPRIPRGLDWPDQLVHDCDPGELQ